MVQQTSSFFQELASDADRRELLRLANRFHWGPALMLAGWLHLLAFTLCWFLTVGLDYHAAGGYLAVWAVELAGVLLIFRLCGGPWGHETLPPLGWFVLRVWIAYLVLGLNLGTMNSLRGHAMFELFPAMASLASFAFLALAVALSRRFLAAVVVMFVCGLLMAAFHRHAYLTFGVGWWAVLNVTGWSLLPSQEGARIDRREEVAAGQPTC